MRETASARRQAPHHVASILDSARKLGIRDAQIRQRQRFLPLVVIVVEHRHLDGLRRLARLERQRAARRRVVHPGLRAIVFTTTRDRVSRLTPQWT